jgi:predicted O-linked N-acetylglucosamine transferase (SPINDLY family)
LQAIGLPELIARSLQDYEAMAVRLAQAPELLASLKAKLAQTRATYPLFDSNMWERQQRGEPPAGFSVAPNSVRGNRSRT